MSLDRQCNQAPLAPHGCSLLPHAPRLPSRQAFAPAVPSARDLHSHWEGENPARAPCYAQTFVDLTCPILEASLRARGWDQDPAQYRPTGSVSGLYREAPPGEGGSSQGSRWDPCDLEWSQSASRPGSSGFGFHAPAHFQRNREQ